MWTEILYILGSPVANILSKYSKEIKIVSIASTGLGSVVGGTLYAMDYVIKSNLISVNEVDNQLIILVHFANLHIRQIRFTNIFRRNFVLI